MRITIEGTEEEIARVMRKLGETREIVTPEPLDDAREIGSIRKAIEEWHRTRPGPVATWVAPNTNGSDFYYGGAPFPSQREAGNPTIGLRVETRSSMVDSDGCRHFFTERN
jgi:hypothetical protein